MTGDSAYTYMIAVLLVLMVTLGIDSVVAWVLR